MAEVALVAEWLSFPKISRQFFDYIPTLVDIYSRYVDIHPKV